MKMKGIALVRKSAFLSMIVCQVVLAQCPEGQVMGVDDEGMPTNCGPASQTQKPSTDVKPGDRHPTTESDAKPVSPEPKNQDPTPTPPPPTPKPQAEADPATGLKEGDRIIQDNAALERQRAQWNAQKDRESLDIRLNASQGGHHQQNVEIEASSTAPFNRPPQVMEEFTDKEGNVWERVRVNPNDLPGLMQQDPSIVFVYPGASAPDVTSPVSNETTLSGKTANGKTLPQAIAGVPLTSVKEKIETPSPLDDKTAYFFSAVNEKLKDSEKASSDEKSLATPGDETAKKAANPLSPNSALTINNDVSVGAAGEEAFAAYSRMGRDAEYFYRIKQRAKNLAQILPGVSAPDAGVEIGSEGKKIQRGLASTLSASGPYHPLAKGLVGLLILVAAGLLARELGWWKKLPTPGKWNLAKVLPFKRRKGHSIAAAPGKKRKASEATRATSATKIKR